MVKDYIKYRLTGEITGDYTDMSGANLMDVRKKSYSNELMALYSLSEVYDALPTLRYSSEIAGKVTPTAAEETGLVRWNPCGGRHV